MRDPVFPPLRKRKATDRGGDLHCSFCGKTQREAKKLIAATVAYICDECVRLCMDIVTEEDPTPASIDPLDPKIVATRARTARALADVYTQAAASLVLDAEEAEKQADAFGPIPTPDAPPVPA